MCGWRAKKNGSAKRIGGQLLVRPGCTRRRPDGSDLAPSPGGACSRIVATVVLDAVDAGILCDADPSSRPLSQWSPEIVQEGSSVADLHAVGIRTATHDPCAVGGYPGRCQNGRFASRRPAEEPAALDSTVELRSKHVVARSIGRWSVRRTLGSTASSSANASAPTANVTWTHGRDHPAGEEQLWTKLAEGLDATGGTQIKTYPHAGTSPRRPGSIRRTGSSST